MSTTENKQIKLALVAMGILFFGTEIIVAYISEDPYTTNQIRPKIALLIAAIYYVLAHHIQTKKKPKQ